MNRSKPAAKSVDMKIVQEIFGNNQELLGRFFRDFMRNSPQILSDIKIAVEARDADGIRRHAHKLKGSLRYLAAEEAIACASALEEIGRTGNLAAAQRAFENLVATYEDVRRFISEAQAVSTST